MKSTTRLLSTRSSPQVSGLRSPVLTSAHHVLAIAEGEAPKLTYEELDTACSIRVEMSFWKRSHEHRDHRGYRRTVQKLPVVTTYHEDTKPAQWGICTG